MSMLVQRYFRRSSAVEDLVEEWQIDHKNAMVALDVQELACECMDLGKLTKHMWSVLCDMLMDGKIEDVEAVGRMLRIAFKRGQHALKLVLAGVCFAESKGYTINKADEFRAVVDEVKETSRDFHKTWPAASVQMANESLAAYHRGEYQDSGDLLSESQSACTVPD